MTPDVDSSVATQDSGADGHATGDATGVAHGELLIEFADAAMTKDEDQIAPMRQKVEQVLGKQAMVDSVATIAIFNAVVKVADATGIPLEPVKETNSQDLRESLNIDQFETPTS